MIRKLFFISVFILSVETRVKKREGETVTLHVNSTGHQLKDFLWNFGRVDPVKAIIIVINKLVTRVNGTRFDGRLHTDVETGSITISNLTVNDTGVFLIQIFKETGTFLEKINLAVQDNGVIPVNALEGNNVTLDSVLDELEEDHNVMWTQGPDFAGYLIAQWQNSIVTIIESFKDILQLDPVNGNLTFLRVTTNLTGFYCVKILKGSEAHILRQYHLTIYEPVSVPNITTAQTNITAEPRNYGVCYVSCSVKNGLDVNLTLYEGEKIIKQTSNSNISISLVLPVELHREKEAIYSLTANNPVSTETISINSTQWCPPHGSDLNIGAITGGVLALIIPVAVIVYLICGRRNQGTTSVCLQMDKRDSSQNNSSQNNSQGTEEPLLDGNNSQHDQVTSRNEA